MDKKLEELYSEDKELAKEHFDQIKAKVEDGSYFKDALDWYFFRYVTAICDRTLLIFGSIISAVVFYFLIQMIESAFPLEVKDPIFIEAKDQSLYFPSLVHLKPKADEAGYDPSIKTVDQAVAKYLVETYVKNREEYDFSDASIAAVNSKFSRIKNTSSEMEYRKFQLFMSKDNPESPINDFGLNVSRKINITSVNFLYNQPQGLIDQAFDYLTGTIPTQAEVRFVATKTIISENQEIENNSQTFLAKVSFSFDGVKKPEKDAQKTIKFTVNNYQLFKVN